MPPLFTIHRENSIPQERLKDVVMVGALPVIGEIGLEEVLDVGRIRGVDLGEVEVPDSESGVFVGKIGEVIIEPFEIQQQVEAGATEGVVPSS